MTAFGYMRVSTKDQNEARQRVELIKFGIDKKYLFIDKQSGKDFLRPAYTRMLRSIRAGDLVVVQSIDRLGRNYKDITEQWRYITKMKKVDIKVLDMPLLDTTLSRDLLGTFISDLVLQLLSFVAETERANIRQRQYEGIRAAKQRGVKFGRPSRPLPDNFYEVYEKWISKELPLKTAAFLCRMPESTFFDKAKSIRNQ